MTPTAVALLVFVGLASSVGAVGLVVRDLRTASRAADAKTAARPLRLQRIRRPEVATAGQSPVVTFDQWFVQLLRDSGLNWGPTVTAALLILWGALCSAVLFVCDERLEPAVAAGMIGAPLPLLYLAYLRGRRLARLQDQLPSALEILARSIRAGRTLEQAVKLLGDHSPEPLAKEFRWCASQMEMGLALPAVMRSLIERVRLYDMRIFATTLIVHRQTGGNIVTVLERLAQVIRERLNYRRQLRAMTAAGRMSAGMVGLVAPGVFLYFFFFRPEYVSTMLHSPLGQMLLALIVVLEVVGLIWTARLLRPSY